MSNHENAPVVDFVTRPVRGMVKIAIEPKPTMTHGKVLLPDSEDTDDYLPRTGIIRALGQKPIQMGTSAELDWDVKVGDRVLLTKTALDTNALRESPDGLPLILIPWAFVHAIIQ